MACEKRNQFKYGIIVIGYNRVESIKRLLSGLSKADYKKDDVTLIISIDNSGEDCVEQIARKFCWKYGEKIVRVQPQKLGLRNHIIRCGKYLDEFQLDAAAVFEDDIYPSPAFYNYMRQAVPFYMDDDRIAGISLYTQMWNETANMPFEPAQNGKDSFFMAYPQSWGQIWLHKQWNMFYEWYKDQKSLEEDEDIPPNVLTWPETSWLKYHVAYCIKMKKYYVYPYQSLSTCFTDSGVHNIAHLTLFQVPLLKGTDKEYVFDKLDEATVKYDAFLEREGMEEVLNLPPKSLCVDIYGMHVNVKNYMYLVTNKKLPYHIVSSYAYEMRPHEENIIYDIRGTDIYLYDLTKTFKQGLSQEINTKLISYYFRLDRSGKWMVKYAIKQKLALIRMKQKKLRKK